MYEFLIFISALFVVMFSSGKAVNYVVKLSKIFGLSGLTAGFVLLSVSTSLPELFVSIISALNGHGSLGIGNVLGANITDVTLVLGIAVLLNHGKQIVFQKKVFEHLIQFLFVSSLIPLFILQSGSVSRLFGMILLLLFIFFSVKTPKKIEEAVELATTKKYEKFELLAKFAVSIVFLLIASNVVVDSSVKIAELLLVPTSIIGATLVSAGTTLPELVTTIEAFRKRLYDVGLGNVIGSCITNLTLVLGASSVLQPTSINIVAVTSLIIFAIIAMLVTWYFVSTERSVDKKEAVILIIIYAIFILQQLGFSAFNIFNI